METQQPFYVPTESEALEILETLIKGDSDGRDDSGSIDINSSKPFSL